MRVIVTRPVREAARWVATLRQQGLDALALPLITIGPAPDAEPLQAAWESLERFSALMFVSVPAVQQFFAVAAPGVLCAWQRGEIPVRAWAPGPGTREALLAAGVPAQYVDAPPTNAAQFDSETLWQQVVSQVGVGSVILMVRGADGRGEGAGREWLAARLRAAGARVENLSAYVRSAAPLDAQQIALARQAATGDSVWLFSSSEALSHLRDALPGQSWTKARAIATHPRIAVALQGAGFGVVCQSRPDLGDIVAALESFQ